MSQQCNCHLKVNVGLVQLSEKDSLIADLLPSNETRSSIARNLLHVYQLDNPLLGQDSKLQIIPYWHAGLKELTKFHDQGYIEQLLKERDWSEFKNPLSKQQSKTLEKLQLHSFILEPSTKSPNYDAYDDSSDSSDSHSDSSSPRPDKLDKYGLKFDCPIFPFINSYIKLVAGTSLSAVSWLIKQNSSPSSPSSDALQTVAVNWTGGRHHAHKTKSSGFCYVNDIVLSILQLRTTFPKIMYIDLDLHHGDGVTKAFKFSDNVLTFSLHRFDLGFFPGSGKLPKDGLGRGKGYEVNFPTRKGLSDFSFHWILVNVVQVLIHDFKPDCIVIQCGGDGLCSESDFHEWNLTIKEYGLALLELIQKYSGPCLLLGGGGYNNLEVAKLWTFITGLLIKGKEECLAWDVFPHGIDEDLIDFQEYEFWGNDKPTNMKDLNDLDYLQSVRDRIFRS